MYKKSTWSYACTCITAGGITKSAQVVTVKREKKNHAEFFFGRIDAYFMPEENK